MMHLYDIAAEYNKLKTQLENEDFDDQVIADTLDALAYPFEEKAIAIGAFCLTLEAELESLELLIVRLQNRRDSQIKKIDWLNDYLKRNMIATGIRQIKGKNGEYRITLYPERDMAILVDDLGSIPQHYLRNIPARWEPDKTLIRKAIKDGLSVPGCHAVKSDRLEIRN